MSATPQPSEGANGRAPWTPVAYVRWLSGNVGSAGLSPVMILMLAASLERFGVSAISVLGPNIRDTFHISNQALITMLSLTSILPALLSPWAGFISDRVDRIRLSQISAVVIGIVSVAMGLSPVYAVLAILILLGGFGRLVNIPTHSSLITDYYAPAVLGTVFTFYLFAEGAIGLIAGPIAGGVGQLTGWRATFIVLAIPTFVAVWLLGRLKDPGRGASLGMAFETEERSDFWEGFRRVRAVRSLRRTWWAAAFFGGGVVAFTAILSVFFRDVYHYNTAARGGTLVVFGLGGLIGTIIGGRLVRVRLRRSQRSCSGDQQADGDLGSASGWSSWVSCRCHCLSIAMLFVLSIGAAGYAPAYNAMIGLVTTPRLRGQAFSYSLIWVTIGAIVVAPTIGGIANHHERAAMYVLGALMVIAGLIEITARQFVVRDVAQAQKLQAASDVKSLLAVRGLEVAYGNLQILFGVDLDVHEGEVVALLGTNGAGKSTFLKAISGLLDPIGGAVFFAGRDVSHADAVNKALLGMALVPGDRGVFPGLTVAENLRIAGWMIRSDTAEMNAAIERVLDYFPVLRDRLDVPAGNMSGGEQQMLVLAQALMGRPKLMMIDELSLGLAPVIVEQLLKTVKRLAEDGMTIVLVEQSVNIALTIAERAVFMEKGEIRFAGKTKDLLKRPDVLRSVFLEGAASAVSKKAAPLARRTRTNGRGRATVLDVRGVSKTFGGVVANTDVSLTLLEGEILGILGPNGAGKTTLFDLISGFFPVDSGAIIFDGLDVTDLPPDARARLGLGRSFQDSKLFPALTVYETIKVALERHVQVRDPLAAALSLPAVIASEAAAGDRVEELIEMLGLQAFRNKFISEISTGTRRMVDLACILAHEPRVILFDEPSSGIAQRESESLGPLLRKIRDLTGSSLLVIEHDMPLLTSLAEEIVALDLGRVVTRGLPSDVVNDPRVVAAYLGADSAATSRSGVLPPALRTVRTRKHKVSKNGHKNGSSNGRSRKAAFVPDEKERKVSTRQNGSLTDMTLGEVVQGLRRYQPFILAVLAIVLIVAFLPGKTTGSNSSLTSGSNGGASASGVNGAGKQSSAGGLGGAAVKGAASSNGSGGGSGGGTAGVGGGVPAPALSSGTDRFCDRGTGRQKLPTLYAPPCVQAFSGDNGGKTYNGVTKDTITVAVPYNQTSATQTAALAQDTDTETQIRQTRTMYNDMFMHHTQTYGRKVNIVYFNSTYNNNGTTAEQDTECQADAKHVALELHAFASLGDCGTDSYENTLVKDGVLCFCTVTIPSSFYLNWAPYVWGTGLPDEEAAYVMRAEVLCNEVNPYPPKFAGESDLNAPLKKKRSFALIWPGPSAIVNSTVYEAGAKYFEGLLRGCGVDLKYSDSFPIVDTNGAQDADPMMAKYKNAKVSDIIVVSDPIDPEFLTAAATKNNYSPEWIVTGSALTDETHFGRLYDQTQWRHAFGMGLVPDRLPQNLTDSYNLFFWQYKSGPPANITYPILYPFFYWFYTGVQLAGPHLTPQTFQCGEPPYVSKTHSGDRGAKAGKPCVGKTYPGIFGYPISPTNYKSRVSNAVQTWGDHVWPWDSYNIISDGALIFWDATAQGPDEAGQNGVGMYRYMHGGHRFMKGEFPKGDQPWFNNANTVTVFGSLPGPDKPPSYPYSCYYMC